MKPTERRQRERINDWARGCAMVLVPLAVMAVAQFVLLLNTLPVTLPGQTPARTAATGPTSSQVVHPRDQLKP